MTQTNPQIRTETKRSTITLDRVYVNEFQKPGTKTAQLRQEVTTKSFYPSKKTASDLQANIFDNKDFGFEEQEFTSTETRMAWILVPENSTEEVVKAKIEAAVKNGALIYRIMSNAPILDENQKYAVAQGIRTIDQFAKTQVSRYSADDEEGRGGQLLLDKAGNVQYRRTFFWNSPIADQDARGKADIKPYVSAEILAELNGASVMTGQTV